MNIESENSADAATVTVSVIVPAYRCSCFISETLDSVFAQAFANFEVIVINDGCPETESLERALERFRGKITYIKGTNAGAAVARNRGVAESSGDLLAFLDGDDIWEADYLKDQVNFLRSRKFDMVYCDADLFTGDGPLGLTYMYHAPSDGEVSVQSLLDLRCNVITSGTVIAREAFDRAGGFENGRVLAEDFHLWLRVARSGASIGFQKKVLLRYRVSDAGLSGDDVKRMERVIDVYQRLERDIELSSEELAVLKRRVRGFEADLAVARGKSYLFAGENGKAAAEFARAASWKRTPKIAGAVLLALIAPKSLRRVVKPNTYLSPGRKKTSDLDSPAPIKTT